MLKAVEGVVARKSVRQTAIAIHGEDAVRAENTDRDGPIRAQVRRLVKKAHFLKAGGYLELAAGKRPRL